MDVARFHRAIDLIDQDFATLATADAMSQLVNNLNDLVGNPGNPNVNQKFKDQLSEFRAKLDSSPMNSANGDLLDVLTTYELLPYVGNHLYDKIRNLLEANQLTPNLAASAISELQQEVVTRLGYVLAIKKAFVALGVKNWQLEEGKTEVLIDLPFGEETEGLEALAEEAKEWNFMCKTVAEVFDPEFHPVTIRTIASGSWLFYLAAVPPFIFGMAKCLKGINAILSELIRETLNKSRLSMSNDSMKATH